MGYSCFLFRDASAAKTADRTKPIQDAVIPTFWYKLLKQLG